MTFQKYQSFPRYRDMCQCPVKIGLVQWKVIHYWTKMTSRNLSTSSKVCECPVNLMLGPVIRTPLLDWMSIQLQFTLGNTEIHHRWTIHHYLMAVRWTFNLNVLPYCIEIIYVKMAAILTFLMACVKMYMLSVV